MLIRSRHMHCRRIFDLWRFGSGVWCNTVRASGVLGEFASHYIVNHPDVANTDGLGVQAEFWHRSSVQIDN
jgi:hypothetical protein